MEVVELSPYRGIVFTGMGGSGIVGEITAMFLERRGVDIPTLVVKDYRLPPCVKEGWLVVAVSYSGNTEETLSAVEEAVRRGSTVVSVSSGGKLKNVALQYNLPHVDLPQGFAPRYALGYMLSAVLSLMGMGDISQKMGEHLASYSSVIKEKAKELAQRLKNYLPVVYATPLTGVCAVRYKAQINENAKTLCHTALLPELHHNEIVGLDNYLTRQMCHFLLLYDREDHPRILRRVQITRDILQEMGLVPIELEGEGESFEERLAYLIYLGDWLSYHLAVLYGFDPLPVKSIDRIKGMLS